MAQYFYVVDTGITTTSLNGVSYPGGISVGQTTYDLLVEEKYRHGVVAIGESSFRFWKETNNNVGIYVTDRLVGIGTSTGLAYQLTVVGSGTSTSALYANQVSVSGITTSLIYATSGTTSSTDGTTAQPQIDARVTEMHYHSASFSGDRSFQISYLTNGRSVRFYIRNTNSSTRSIGFQASTTDSFGGGSTVELSGGGGYSSTSFSISGISGGSTATAMVWIANIGGNFVGVVQ